MSEETAGDTYFEVQVDRETVVLAAAGLVVLLVTAFFVGRWSATEPQAEPAELVVAAPAAADELEMEADIPPLEEVDGEPLFGQESVSVAGAPALGAVPERATREARTSPPPERAREQGAKPSLPRTSPTAQPSKKPAEKSPAASGKGWVVQVAALKTMNDAESLQRRLSKTYPVRILASGGFFKVQVGPFSSLPAAKKAERSLKRQEKLSTWIKKA